MGMARQRRIYSAPLVMTLAALPFGCGEGANANPDENHELRGSGGSDGVGIIPTCDLGELSGATPTCQSGDVCRVETNCTSGVAREFLFECDTSQAEPEWVFASGDACSNPSESCRVEQFRGTFNCHSEWSYTGAGGNPPAPCPDTLPANGEACPYGPLFGIERDTCGYPCADGGWTVTECEFDETCGFRTMTITRFGPCRSPVSVDRDHRFRCPDHPFRSMPIGLKPGRNLGLRGSGSRAPG